MKIAMIGLGRMGFHMSERLLEHKFEVIAYNRSQDKVRAIAKKGAIPAGSLEECLAAFGTKKKIVWLMLPAGTVTEEMIDRLLPLLKKGDIIVNGANAFYKHAQEQSERCVSRGVHLFDAGVSGGIHGLERGYALMFGGPKSQYKYIKPFAAALAPKGGFAYFGPVGSGHFVKSVHNIVEYVFMEGLAEGAELLGDFEHPIDVQKAFETWQPASIVTSALLDWTVQAMKRKDFKTLKPDIMSETLKELTETVRAVKGQSYATAFLEARSKRLITKGKKFEDGRRLIAGIRREFGGHAVKKK